MVWPLDKRMYCTKLSLTISIAKSKKNLSLSLSLSASYVKVDPTWKNWLILHMHILNWLNTLILVKNKTSKHSMSDLVYTQIHTLYFDDQSQVWIKFYLLLDIRQGMNMEMVHRFLRMEWVPPTPHASFRSYNMNPLLSPTNHLREHVPFQHYSIFALNLNWMCRMALTCRS